MVIALADVEFGPGRGRPLLKLCQAGAQYGWQELEATGNPDLLIGASPRARASLTRDLRCRLELVTRPCLELERTSFGIAMQALGMPAERTNPGSTDRRFLGHKPSHRLFSLFKKYPALPRLWCQLISHWREHVMEVLLRFTEDRTALSRTFFGGQPIGTIVNFRCSLSDPHRNGRTVMQLQFEAGAVIYKPRSGRGEWEWFSLLASMNRQDFQPKLRAAHVLRRKDYCWMEDIKSASLTSEAAARRFYERMGALIAAAYLLKAVDCHRDNIIASGEYPVLVDADALWHVSAWSKTQSFSDVLHRTGFFPTANPRSLQSRSSALGPWGAGKHVPLAGRPLRATSYRQEITAGFAKAWRCILGTRNGRAQFARRLRRVRSHERRWIYWPTEKYSAIIKASIHPSALRSGAERNLLIRRLCSRDIVPSAVVDAEVLALKQLDIPYFLRATNEKPPPDKLRIPAEVIQTIRGALPDPRRAGR
ncbi:MAG TPA: type 2 lanthipeptide synthetase LanM [Chthoniobacterales bacterium]|nr:type 2 lanthipeptide synthetase LanM [Chthoniobacterales bacterium]